MTTTTRWRWDCVGIKRGGKGSELPRKFGIVTQAPWRSAREGASRREIDGEGRGRGVREAKGEDEQPSRLAGSGAVEVGLERGRRLAVSRDVRVPV